MKPTDPNLDTLLGTTRKLPTELSRERVEQLVADFPHGGPAPAPSGVLPKLLTIIVLVVTAALLVTYFGRTGEAPALSGIFPGDPTPPTERLAVLPPVVEEVDVPAPALAAPVPQLITESVAPPAFGITEPIFTPQPIAPAPAAAPNNPPAPLSYQAPQKIAPPAEEAVTSFPFGATIISGTWRWTDGKRSDVLLEYVERVNGRKITWMLPAKMTATERDLLFPRGATTSSLERETGRVILMKDSKEFSFQPRTALRDRYEDLGWGTSDVPAAALNLHGAQQGVSFKPAVFTDRPADVLWLRYFTSHVGVEYQNALANLGLSRSELVNTWQLVNVGLDVPRLEKLAGLLDQASFNTDGITVDVIVSLHKNRSLLTKMEELDYELDVEAWRQLTTTDIKPWYVERINKEREELFTAPELARLHAANFEAYEASILAKATGRELNVAELLALQEAGITAQDINRAYPNGYGGGSISVLIEEYREPTNGEATGAADVPYLRYGDDYPAEKEGWVRSTQSLPPFTKLDVAGDIRVVVVRGEQNSAVISKPDNDELRIELEVSRNGTLRIRKRLPWNIIYRGFIQAEIRLTATALRSIEARGRAVVLVKDDFTKFKVSGDVGQLTVKEGKRPKIIR